MFAYVLSWIFLRVVIILGWVIRGLFGVSWRFIWESGLYNCTSGSIWGSGGSLNSFGVRPRVKLGVAVYQIGC